MFTALYMNLTSKEKYIKLESSDIFRLELEGVNLRLDKTLLKQVSLKP